jgi:hypothetical protein
MKRNPLVIFRPWVSHFGSDQASGADSSVEEVSSWQRTNVKANSNLRGEVVCES